MSLDAWLRRRRGLSRPDPFAKSLRYGLPLSMLWLLFSVIYFFPGVWKVWDCGLDWALTDSFRNHMWHQWNALGGWLPALRIDQIPLFYRSAGLFTIFFELFFVFWILRPATRPIAVAAGLAFHLASWVFMKIVFLILAWAYWSFVDWDALRDRILGRRTTSLANQGERDEGSRRFAVAWAGGLLLSFNVLFGALAVDSWPFTCFPTFNALWPSQEEVLRYQWRSADGEDRVLDKELLRSRFGAERLLEMEAIVLGHHRRGELEERDHRIRVLAGYWEDHLEEAECTSLRVEKLGVSLEPGADRSEAPSEPLSDVAYACEG